MALAGYCRGCGQYVWLNEQWGCVNGHPWTEIGNWYDPEHGTPVTPHWLQPAPSSGAPVPPATPQPAAATAPMPVAPSAEAAAAPADRLTLLADMLATLGQYPNYAPQYGTDTDIVVSNEVANASGGTGTRKIEFSAIMKAVEAERTIYYWEMNPESDYAATRRIVEDVAARHGWQVKVVLKKNSAQW